MEDFDAQVGARKDNAEHVLEKLGYGTSNRNGQKLVYFLWIMI